jgi:Carbohydrate binding domain (family 11)
MKDTDQVPERLSQEPGTPEQELLRSAKADRPDAQLYAKTVKRVLDTHRRDSNLRRYRALGAVAAALAVAAGAALLLRPPSPAPRMTAEAAPVAAPPKPTPSVPQAPPGACAPVSIGAGKEPLLDDFEDGDTRIPLLDKRAGSWIVYNDGTAKQEPRQGSIFPATRLPQPRGTSRFGLRSTGGKFTKWGAAVAIELTPHRCYDASAYAGFAFWARGRGTVRVNLRMAQVVGEEYGGTCVSNCYDSHGVVRTLTREWKRYEVRWEDVLQQGFGTQVAFDPHWLYSLEFALPQGQPPFDFWLDDVTLLEH